MLLIFLTSHRCNNAVATKGLGRRAGKCNELRPGHGKWPTPSARTSATAANAVCLPSQLRELSLMRRRLKTQDGRLLEGSAELRIELNLTRSYRVSSLMMADI